jgi:hypothetical protein
MSQIAINTRTTRAKEVLWSLTKKVNSGITIKTTMISSGKKTQYKKGIAFRLIIIP